MKSLTFFLSSFLLVVGCKKSVHELNEQNFSSGLLLKSNETAPSMNWGVVDVDKEGRLKARLILSLDYISIENGVFKKIPSCMDPVSDSFGPIGHAVCVRDQKRYWPIHPAHVFQECYTNKEKIPVRPRRDLIIENCEEVTILGFHFTPELKLDIEPLR
ncbi:MAG: hypothetical protein HQK54_16295 [Oligoflexales bacterium]|nr:hypothetical protein [Oligoflexales bacterium]